MVCLLFEHNHISDLSASEEITIKPDRLQAIKISGAKGIYGSPELQPVGQKGGPKSAHPLPFESAYGELSSHL